DQNCAAQKHCTKKSAVRPEDCAGVEHAIFSWQAVAARRRTRDLKLVKRFVIVSGWKLSGHLTNECRGGAESTWSEKKLLGSIDALPRAGKSAIAHTARTPQIRGPSSASPRRMPSSPPGARHR